MCSESFLDWCRASRIDTSAVTPALISIPSGSSYRGLVAARDLSPGDALAVVPAKLLLSATGSARRDCTLGPLLRRRALDHQTPPLTHHQILAIHLLLERHKGRESAWFPYLRELPSSYTVLAAWPRSARRELQAPYARRQAARAARAARRERRLAQPLLLEALGGGGDTEDDLLSKSAWLWAHGTVLSRTMALGGGGPEDNDHAGCLTPFGDLLNHAPPRGAPWAPDPSEEIAGLEREDEEEEQEDEEEEEQTTAVIAGDGALDAKAEAAGESGAYVLHTRRAVPRGAEALLSYGRHTNLELLLLYGFLLPRNLDDRAELPRALVQRAMGVVVGEEEEEDEEDESSDDASSSSSSDNPADTTTTNPTAAPLASHGGAEAAASWHVQASDGRPSWALFEALRRRAEEQEEEEEEDKAVVAAARGPANSSSSSQKKHGAPTPTQSPHRLNRQALKVERWLRAACLAALAELPTTADKDEAWLGSDEGASATPPPHDASECLRLAVEWRLQYKRALLRGVARCDRAIERLSARMAGDAAAATTRPPPLPVNNIAALRRGRILLPSSRRK